MAAFALVLTGCALKPYSMDECADSQECREAFGLGWVCSDEGYCDQEPLHPRCDRVEPVDLLTDPEAYPDPFVIGTLYDHGPDLPNLQSTRLAIVQANAENGINKQPVGLISCSYEEDTELDTLPMDEAAQETAQWLAESLGVRVIVGPGTSALSVQLYGVMAKRDVLLIAPSSTSPDLIEIDGAESTDEAPGLFWRPAPPDSGQVLAIAADMAHRGVGHVAIIYQDAAYGAALAGLVEVEHGGAVDLYPFTDDNSRNQAVLDVGGSDGVEEVMLISSEVQDVVAMLNAIALASGYDGKTFFLTDASFDAELLTGTSTDARALFDRVRGSRPQTPQGPTYDAFKIAYASEYDGEDPSNDAWNAYAYDAAWMALYGMSWAHLHEGDIGGTSVARGLRQLADADGMVLPVGPATWLDVQNEFAQGRAVDVEGASGPLDFDPITSETANPIDIWVIDAGGTDFVIVRTCTPEGDCADVI